MSRKPPIIAMNTRQDQMVRMAASADLPMSTCLRVYDGRHDLVTEFDPSNTVPKHRSGMAWTTGHDVGGGPPVGVVPVVDGEGQSARHVPPLTGRFGWFTHSEQAPSPHHTPRRHE